MRRFADRLRLRLRSLFRGEHADASLHRELAHHLEELTAEYVAQGMPPAEAPCRRFAPSVRRRASPTTAATRGACP
jgi:hypothetical protein